ncbi:hypothetical protein PG984_003245 [Apiospora sp. TS-2023a]
MVNLSRSVATYAGLALSTTFSSLAITLSERALEIPTPEKFIRRTYASVAVLGDYVYINGGGISQLDNGVRYEADGGTMGRFSPYTHDPRGADPSSLRFLADAFPPTFRLQMKRIRHFLSPYPLRGPTRPDGNRGGVWTQVTPTNVVAFSNVVRPSYVPFTTNNHVGYALGGLVRSAPGGDDINVSGLVSFDTGSLKWANTSSSGYGNYGTNNGGQMEYAPFGSNALSWDTVRFIDLSTGKWYSQPITGPRPIARGVFCSVGVQGPNGSYEIFIYGGFDSTTNSTAADMYVLSLPGFVFFKLPNLGVPRAAHACALVGPFSGEGNKRSARQMLSVGGAEYAWGDQYLEPILDSDPWKQGLGIFDLTDMAWKNQYNAGADPYDTPGMVRDWYAQGGIDSVSWANNEIKAMFNPGTNKTVNPTSSDTPSTTESGRESSSNNPNTAPDNKLDRNGIIVGITVGGVVGVALIIALAVFLLHYRARRRQAPRRQRDTWFKAELPTEGVKQQQLDRLYYPELDSNQGHSELGPECRHEMPG